jgi:NhaP-type Na+/H+ or K+/H+ antiporter
MAAGVALPKAYLRTELKSLLILLGPVMIYMWLASGLFVWGLIPGLNFVNYYYDLFILIIITHHSLFFYSWKL